MHHINGLLCCNIFCECLLLYVYFYNSVNSKSTIMGCFHLTEESVHGIVIEALLSNSADISTCQLVISAFALGETRRIPCRPDVTGSIVKLRAAGTEKGYLSLCEVQVYGVYGRSMAFTRT